MCIARIMLPSPNRCIQAKRWVRREGIAMRRNSEEAFVIDEQLV